MHGGKVNWAIVGLGDIVRKRAGAAIQSQPQSTLYACVTRNPDARQAEIQSLKPEKVLSDFREMLADPRVDAVYLATPVAVHAPQAIAALEAGKDVLVEKPMALDTAEAARMCQSAERTGRRLAVAYFRRFSPRYQLVKDMLDRGQFGRVVLVRIAMHSWYAGRPDGWREKPELSGGGVLADVGVHKFDLLAWWFGMPRRLIARVDTLAHDYAAEESAVLLLTLPGDLECTASFHWNSKTWTDEIHVVGTEAKLTLHPSDGDEALITVGREVECRKISNAENLHAPLFDDFARAIVEDRPPRFTGPDGISATRILEAAYESSRKGAWLEIG
ncbi:MAG: Gfo/Idh/MocA family oxidoreductase [Planctomycetota bacterium]